MRTPGKHVRVAGLVGVATGFALLLAAPASAGAGRRAAADRDRGDESCGRVVYREHPVFAEHPGNGGKKHRHAYRDGRVRYVVVRRPGMVVVRPIYPDYFIVRRPRFVVVRPVPYWPVAYGNGVTARIGVNIGGVHFGLGFQPTEPHYGCNFCDAYFGSYGAWEAHVTGCAHGARERVICEPWGDGDVDALRAGAQREWERYEGPYSEQ